MSFSIKKLFSDKTFLMFFIGSIFFIFINIVFILITIKNLPPFIPLFNQMPWGEPRLGEKIQILIPFSIALFFCISDFVISGYVYKAVPLVSRFLGVTSFIISFLALLLVIRTVIIVI